MNIRKMKNKHSKNQVSSLCLPKTHLSLLPLSSQLPTTWFLPPFIPPLFLNSFTCGLLKWQSESYKEHFIVTIFKYKLNVLC